VCGPQLRSGSEASPTLRRGPHTSSSPTTPLQTQTQPTLITPGSETGGTSARLLMKLCRRQWKSQPQPSSSTGQRNLDLVRLSVLAAFPFASPSQASLAAPKSLRNIGPHFSVHVPGNKGTRFATAIQFNFRVTRSSSVGCSRSESHWLA